MYSRKRRSTYAIAVTTASFLQFVSMNQAVACSRVSDCKVGDRTYRIALPKDFSRSRVKGAVIFVHGYRGKAAFEMKNKKLTETILTAGQAFVAAQASGVEWAIPGVPSVDAPKGIDDLAYFDRVVLDLRRRFQIQNQRLVVAGFSSGAMMVWNLACYRGKMFRGFIPMSGTFWRPLPNSCPARATRLIHFHGRQDPIVPLEGRKIKDGFQGNVFKAIELFVNSGKYNLSSRMRYGGVDCRRQANAEGNFSELCLFDGKHQMPPNSQLRRALRTILQPKKKPKIQ